MVSSVLRDIGALDFMPFVEARVQAAGDFAAYVALPDSALPATKAALDARSTADKADTKYPSDAQTEKTTGAKLHTRACFHCGHDNIASAERCVSCHESLKVSTMLTHI